ncbi:tetratricopeptide repeat protein [Parafrankia sp. FMc6]|uniref:tetratricopeptide repeat protein n=1 Tax=Parafrankia soli TaxID=2599596 RepID=UPI0034D41333
MDNLRRITDELRRMDDQIGSGSLVQVVRSQAAYVTDLLKNGRYTDSVGRDLYGTLAELLRLAGWLSFDAGRHGQAQRFFVAGLRSAHTAGERALGANILGFMSCQAKDIGQFTESARFADSARKGYTGGSSTVSAILNMRAAQAYANLKDVPETRRAIDSAFDVFGGATPDHGEPPWSYWFDEAQINEQVGYCYMRLGDWERAREHLFASTGGAGESDSREGALRQALLADTYAQQGDPDSACAIGNQAIDALASEVDSARCVGHVKQVSQHLAPYRGLAAVQEFDERVKALSGSVL